MKPKQLHITNGDCTTQLLQKIKMDGKIITWREMLCEGRTTSDIGSESFWKSRFDFFSKNYSISKKHFIDYTLKEFRNLCLQKSQQEIVLWFEHDLFCQINMIAVISWLKKHKPKATLSLVCPENKKNSNLLLSISDLTQQQLKTAFKNRTELTIDDLEYADYIWQLYCADSPLQLQTIAEPSSAVFKFIPEAIKTHLKRFPTIKNGLNDIENTIINTAANHDFKSKKELINHLLKNQDIYGFGDLQYERKIDRLKGLFKRFKPISLNDLGYDVLQNQQNYYHSIKRDYSYLGGTLKYNYLYNTIDGKLLKL
ncbi:MAG: DUF1835 domain-containing protein [Flavobacteriaceae bacterium]